MSNHYLLGPGELALKGKNRHYFERHLVNNINRRATRDKLSLKAKLIYGKILVKTDIAEEKAISFLAEISGIATIRPVIVFPYDYEVLKNGLCACVKAESEKAETFRITTNRAFKSFPKTSVEVSCEMGGVILDGFPHLKVNLTKPDLEITIDIRSEGFFVSHKKIRGAGGFPEGTQGRGLLLLSGGIDSPAAGYLAMKKGLYVDAVYFHTPPFTSQAALDKVTDLARTLKRLGSRTRINLYVVNISALQQKIITDCDQSAGTILLRVVMVKTAAFIAGRDKYDALITGDSLGQVASQTLQSLSTVDSFTDKFILRPLMGMDKSEIIRISEKIGTIEISNRPFEDCCTLFVPKHPQTKPVKESIQKEFEQIDFDSFISDPGAFIDKIKM